MEDRYLFRSKRLDNGQWVQGNLVYSEDSEDGWETLIIPTRESNMFTKDGSKGNLGFENWYRVEQDTICQCTGLKDKNGKLIWENDIMLAHLDENYPEDETYIRILWNGSGFCSKEKGSEDISPIDKFDQEHFEVIGNIIDSPELMGGTE